ncbi:tigger transposable element-derived protein 4 [Nematostella vectensis]|uniref:tigger transposable element-derived protein 4 n=1 Tax=Nematostella vectensis TaxID=45351 RepID=UPI002076F2E5|nr:tigger transposable element-derived protein 4 [Nematostella vectensis]
MASKQARIELSLKKKVEVLKLAAGGASQRKLADQFKVSKTQISNIIKKKNAIEEAFEQNSNSEKRRFVSAPNDRINDAIWEWFTRCQAMNIPVASPMIQARALKYAEMFGIGDFKASNGWLESFKRRKNIHCSVLSGESSSVPTETVDEWQSRLEALCEGYRAADIFNMDETGMFYRALPDRSLVVRGADCHGGKHLKERLTAVLTYNMTGEFTKTWIIGKSENPRCFKNLDKNSLPVVYKYNGKAWMTSPLYTEYILDLDRQMRLQNRKILLFEDNAPSHVKDIELTNIKVVFYPPNTSGNYQELESILSQEIARKSCLSYQ